ncbi:MAG: class I SAM-dependent methyltransferase [Leptospirales bacterium]|nr:class I SAM-dependent methyltransferase [Leptospirales bacterium]
MDVLTQCNQKGFPIPDRLLNSLDWEKVDRFASFLEEKNEPGGFFSQNDAARILERHIYENLIFVDYVSSRLKVSRETKLADAGSGPGLPGYLFHCLKDPPAVTLIDSSKRRLSFLEAWANDSRAAIESSNEPGKVNANTARLNFRYERLEEMKASYDIITIRALIPFPFCIEIVAALQPVGGHLFLATTEPPPKFKGLQAFGYVSRETYVPSELTFLGARSILHLEKIAKQDSRYPRSWKIIQQEMQKWKESTR